MASIEQSEAALHALADRLAAVDPAQRARNALDRTLSCTLTDLEVIFGGQLRGSLLVDIHRVEDAKAEVRLRMTSDDLVAMVDGELKLAGAWASGRIKIDARVFDLIKLRSLF